MLYNTIVLDRLGCLRWHLCIWQKKKKKKALKPDSHADAVLALSWNRDYRNVLASGSADTTVKVWDLATEQCSATLDYHQDKVQAVAWNPAQASVLLSGGFDKAVCLVRLVSIALSSCWDTLYASSTHIVVGMLSVRLYRELHRALRICLPAYRDMCSMNERMMECLNACVDECMNNAWVSRLVAPIL